MGSTEMNGASQGSVTAVGPAFGECVPSGTAPQGRLLKALGALAVAAVAALASVPGNAFAADTLEGLDVGEVGLEAYQSLENFRGGTKDLAVGHEIYLGVGVHRYLTAQVGLALSTNGRLEEGEGSFSFTLISTVLDTDRFDLDLSLGFDGGLVPGLELNLDFTESLGVYLRASASISGRWSSASEGKELRTDEELSVIPGIVWTVGKGRQLFLEGGLEFLWSDEEDVSGDLSLWSVAVGYNFMVTDGLEVVTEAKTFRPDGGEQEFALCAGVIASY